MKWPWSRPSPTPEWELRLERLEREVKAVTMEWEEWFDKFRRLYARLAKRVSDANREVVEQAEGQEGNGAGVVAAPPRPAGWERDKRFLRQLSHELTNRRGSE